MKKRIFTFSLAALFLFCCNLLVQAEVKLPAIFSDNMVLQQNSSVAIWGWATPGSTVRVLGSWNNKSYTAKADNDGKWKVKIQTPAAGFTPYRLAVTQGNTISLQNVLIGEVWFCSGQSNMEMPMKGFTGQPIEGGPEAINASKNPNIRMFTVSRVSELYPQEDCKGTWEEASPATTPNFSATAYYFGRMLNSTLNVPVGLIHSSWGGSRIEAWMDADMLKEIPEKKIPQKKEDITIVNGTPTVLFNGMVKPVLGYGIRGAIWYQGESNRGEPELYVKMFDKMVRGWRTLWEVGEFPFYYCQIAPYNYGPSNTVSGLIREAQEKGMTTTPNTGMAVLMDANSFSCIHPPKKKDAGERMALWALAGTYGMTGIEYKSPKVVNVEITGRLVTLTTDAPNNPGLTSYGKEIKGFMVAGEDKRFYNGIAGVSGNKIYVFSTSVAKPVAVRYCFDDTIDSEIFTVGAGLPISSFRTDDWK